MQRPGSGFLETEPRLYEPLWLEPDIWIHTTAPFRLSQWNAVNLQIQDSQRLWGRGQAATPIQIMNISISPKRCFEPLLKSLLGPAPCSSPRQLQICFLLLWINFHFPAFYITELYTRVGTFERGWVFGSFTQHALRFNHVTASTSSSFLFIDS